MSEIGKTSLSNDSNSSSTVGHKADSDEGYSDYRLEYDEDWDDNHKTIMDMGPLHINADDLGTEALEIPSPAFECVSSSGLTSELSCMNHKSGDVRDPSAPAGVAGLCNLGNTCFMNSGLQCLLSNDRLVKYFIEEFKRKDDEMMNHTLAGSFSRLLHRFWQGGFSRLHPLDFKNSVGIDHPQFSDHRQHDCQEFLALLLDSFHEYLNHQNVTVPNNAYVNETSSPLSAGQESDQPDFDTLHLDGDQSISVSEPTQLNSQIKDNLNSTSSVGSSHFGIVSQNCLQVESDPDAVVSSGENVVVEEHDKLASSDKYINVDMEVDEENFHKKIPCIDDFCSKDTKTLNTNVLVTTDDTVDLLTTDSTKFHKQDNSAITADEEDVEDDVAPTVLDGGQLHELFMAACASKPVKETNLVANCHEKFTDNEKISLSASLWDQTAVTIPSKDCFAVDGSKRFFGSEPLESSFAGCDGTEDDEKPDDINNVKRIKIDDLAAEKNMRMQAKIKVNVEQNQTWGATHSPMNNPCVMSGFGDQLCSSPMSTASSSSTSDSMGPLQPQAVDSSSVCSTVEGLLQMQYVRSAERAWQAYTSRNQSIVVNTFQGQFKSTVVCSECRHVSVTFEPFMYLSVPLPHALERQISVIFIPCDSKQPVRYLVTVHRLDLVRHLRAELMRMTGEDESCELVFAEVLDHHVARILEDTMQVKMLNDADRMIYAFETLPMPVVEIIPDDVVDQSRGQSVMVNTESTSAAASSYASCSMLPTTNEVLDDVISLLTGSISPGIDVPVCSVLNNSIGSTSAPAVGSESVSIHLESNPVVDWQHNVLSDISVINTVTDHVWPSMKQDPLLSSGAAWSDEVGNINADINYWQVNSTADNCNAAVDGCFSGHHVNCDPLVSSDTSGLKGTTKESSVGGNASTDFVCSVEENDLTCAAVADQWKSCVICLEEMADSELTAHASCGGTLCHLCLEMSTKHLGSPFSKCPVCNAPVTTDDDFIPLSCMETYKPKTRILSVPVVNRYVCTVESSSSVCRGKEALQLFGHPNVLYLPSKLTGSLLYETVDRIVPLLANYSIVLTNGQGSRCSRCLYTQHCSGCELSREAVEITLRPGDHLAVQFGELSWEQVEVASRFVDHSSMDRMRPNTTMSLYDCFRAFTESEVLDEHNPWFCPRCHKNQCASKTMSVWRYPDTLIVYLKRFVYHELSSTKIDSKVMFPLEGLDLSDYISGPGSSDLVYDLQSCVLHFGGVNSGHYTAYARHPVSNTWLYTNDETVVKQAPSESDYSHVYILFYQRRGSQASFNLPSNNADESEELVSPSSTSAQPCSTLNLKNVMPSVSSDNAVDTSFNFYS